MDRGNDAPVPGPVGAVLDDEAKRAYVDVASGQPRAERFDDGLGGLARRAVAGKVMCGLRCAHHSAANGGNFEPNPTTSAKLCSPSPLEDENAMADARSQTTIDDERVRVTTWSFEKAGDGTGAHVHEYDYVLVPVTGGTLTAVSTTDGSARTITQVAGSPYTGQAGLAHTVTADADGIVFVEVELKK
jgi:beta-alanine degradation protein BauB